MSAGGTTRAAPTAPAVPASTYRLQFRQGFGFRDALRAVPHLHALGITHLYASPILAARSGSPHGYDVVDPTRLDPALGTREDFDRLCHALRDRDMGLLLDIVPNHMAASLENPWWVDVLQKGRQSAFAGVFDIDWEALDGKVLLPVLAEPYGDAIAKGAVLMERSSDGPRIAYGDLRLPVATDTPGSLVEGAVRASTSLRRRPAGSSHGGSAALPPIGAVRAIDAVVAAQHYLLSYWRGAQDQVNYRRFFDVADLVAVRAGEPAVFQATHGLILELVRRGLVGGIRVDHVDGLADPRAYLERLRASVGPGVYVVVEKILARNEELPASWPVAGTTGYEFTGRLGETLVDEEGRRRLAHLHADLTGRRTPFAEVAERAKRMVLRDLFAADVAALAERVLALARGDPLGRDLTRRQIERAIVELTAVLPVYRTYADGPIRDGGPDDRSVTGGPAGHDRRGLREAVQAAHRRTPEAGRSAVRFLGRVLSASPPEDAGPRTAGEWRRARVRWEQLSAAAMAKGVEDTALYAYSALISLNEVGGEPAAEGLTPRGFHRFNGDRLRRHPDGLSTTTTHDTKRSEDVRARLHVLSEMPDRWEEHVRRWFAWNARRKVGVRGRDAPDRHDEYLLYQTLVGVWPLTAGGRADLGDRVEAFMVKAVREAKVHTSWIDQDREYETAVRRFVRGVLSETNRRFLGDVGAFAARVALPGMVNALAQTLVKVCSPGVPDLYQGTETWNLRLVDPDNRQPADLSGNERLLAELEGGGGEPDPEALLGQWPDGRLKLWVTSRALRYRRANRELFARGAYVPLEPKGPRRQHVLAFARRRRGAWALVMVPRLPATLIGERTTWSSDPWRRNEIVLPPGAPSEWTDVLTGAPVRTRGTEPTLDVAECLSSLPGALLHHP